MTLPISDTNAVSFPHRGFLETLLKVLAGEATHVETASVEGWKEENSANREFYDHLKDPSNVNMILRQFLNDRYGGEGKPAPPPALVELLAARPRKQ